MYDAKARPIKTFSTNFLGGYTQIDSNLDTFSGRLNYTETRHKRLSGDSELYIKEVYTYSDQDRLMTHTHQIGTSGTPQLLASNTYDELGQLTSKNVGNTTTTPLQKIDYAYNIRGWLTGINNDPTNNLVLNTTEKDLFAFKINYNTVENCTNYTGTALYNGNISETYWRSASDNVQRKYGYKYDNLNRLRESIYQKPGLTTDLTLVTNAYDENIAYDKNGNITSLNRKGNGDPQIGAMVIDDLTYVYMSNSSNQLLKVTESLSGNDAQGFVDANKTDDYTYDANGNLIKDKNKNITEIIYNHLNLPIKITFGAKGTISYIYNAMGQKLQKEVNPILNGLTRTKTIYSSGFQYIETTRISKPPKPPGCTRLQYFPTAEGYVENTAGFCATEVYSYVYNYTDHLGNVRLSYKDTDKNGAISSNEILEESNYYPFGLKHNGYNSNNSQLGYKYKYNGKELQDELGLNMYDMEARNYMPDIGRWGVIDELAENFRDSSPYNFSNNNPISFSDPSGMAPEASTFIASTFIDPNGKVVEHRDDGDDNVYLVGNNWEKGGSKKGLSIVGKEKPGVIYHTGLNYQFDENGELDYADYKRPPMASGAITPIGGAFDIFGFWEAFGMATEESDIDFGAIALILSKGKYGKVSTSLFSSIGKNSKKMTLVQLEKLLGKNWHQNSTKGNFMKRFRKELKGDTNADFYIDKTTNEVLLKSNKSKNWIPTGTFLN